LGVIALACLLAASAAVVPAGRASAADNAPYVKKATWHETMLASRDAIAAGKGPAAAPAGLRPLDKGRWTVMAWVRTKRGGTIFSKAPARGNWAKGGKTLFISGGRIMYDIGWVGCARSRGGVADGTWRHVTLVGGGSRQEIHLDGQLLSKSTMATSSDVKGHVVKIGYTNSNFGGAFSGEIDEVRFYGRALSANEIKTCFAKPDSAPAAGLEGRWAFDGDCLDSSGRNNHAVKTIKTAFAKGKIGKALKLTGSGRVILPTAGQAPDPYAPLWTRLSRDFANEAARREMAWERADGIWSGKVGSADISALARRYAAASHRSGPLSKQAVAAAANAKTPGDLAKVRTLYLRSRRYAEAMARLGQVDLAGLRAMLKHLAEKDPKAQRFVKRLDALETQAAAWADADASAEALEKWQAAIHTLRHDALVANNPLMNFDELLFVKRFKYQSNHYYTDFINGCRKFGGSLCKVDLKTGRQTDLAASLNEGIFGRYDLSFDARKIVFAWKKARDEGFRIWEVGVDGQGLRQLTFPPDNEAELQEKYRRGYHHGTDDMDPCYLPDGGICFISTRCQYGILCDGPDIFTTTLLYRMDADGKNMEKLTNSAVSEATPAVTNDGRIVYTRWEYLDKGAVANKCLWAARPDGTGQIEIYGNDIALPPTFTHGRPIPGTYTKFVFTGTPHYPQNSIGTIIVADITKNLRTREPMTYITPDIDIRREGGFWHDRGSKWGTTRYFKDPYPLSEKFFLVSMNKGKKYNDMINWGLYLLDSSGETALIHKDAAIGCFQPMPLRPRTKPPIPQAAIDPELAKKDLAVCAVTDIYHGMEDTERGTIKYIRINEQVPRPWAARRYWGGDCVDQQHSTISLNTHLGLKVQHGVVPVESDGSAHFYVPADANVFFQALDADYLEVQRERTCVNYRPGESRTCIGCHEMPKDAPVNPLAGTTIALRRAPSMPGPQPGEKSGARTLHYITDVQPVLDKHCVKCHSGDKPKAGLDLSGTLTRMFNVSYENLLRRRVFPIIGENHPKTGNVHYLPAKSLGSHASLLVAIHAKGKVTLKDPRLAARAAKLAKVHEKVTLSRAEMIRLTTWVDSNGQYYGTYYGRKNLQYKDHPNFRPVPTFATACRRTAPLPHDQR